MQPGDVCLAQFPFGGTVGRKLRPVLVLTPLLGPVPQVLVAYLSSVIPTPLLPTDLVIDPARPEHAGTNLAVPSVVRLHKLATIHHRDVARRLGRLSPRTEADGRARLKSMLGL